MRLTPLILMKPLRLCVFGRFCAALDRYLVVSLRSQVQAGADVNCADNDGCTPVSSAEESVKHLLVTIPQSSAA